MMLLPLDSLRLVAEKMHVITEVRIMMVLVDKSVIFADVIVVVFHVVLVVLGIQSSGDDQRTVIGVDDVRRR